MTPREHLAEAQRLLARAATFDDSDRAGLPRAPGDYRLERRAADVTAALAHALVAQGIARADADEADEEAALDAQWADPAWRQENDRLVQGRLGR